MLLAKSNNKGGAANIPNVWQLVACHQFSLQSSALQCSEMQQARMYCTWQSRTICTLLAVTFEQVCKPLTSVRSSLPRTAGNMTVTLAIN